MIRKQYFLHIHSFCCNTTIQFSFFQSWDTCAAAETIMLPLLCEDSYAINRLQKKPLISENPHRAVELQCCNCLRRWLVVGESHPQLLGKRKLIYSSPCPWARGLGRVSSWGSRDESHHPQFRLRQQENAHVQLQHIHFSLSKFAQHTQHIAGW